MTLPFKASVFLVKPIELSTSASDFSLSTITLSSKRFWIFPSSLDFSPSLPESEALEVQPRSFSPISPAVSKPIFKLQPRPSKLPRRDSRPLPPDAVIVKIELPVDLNSVDTAAAQAAWNYINRNGNASTGLVNAVEDYSWTTLWDQGSAILGIHAARQLKLITPAEFKTRIAPLLQTLKTLPLAPTALPNKAYSTRTAQMRTLDNAPDPQGKSGWSVLDTARLLLSLHVIRTHYPEYKPQVNAIVARWKLSQLVKDGWLQQIDRKMVLVTWKGFEAFEAPRRSSQNELILGLIRKPGKSIVDWILE